MAKGTVEPTGNRLPARLPREELERLRHHPGHVSFALGEDIHESGGRQSREGVTHAAGRLQESGPISYVRGRITILHRRGLEEAVCERYKVVKDTYDRLLG